MAALAQAGAGVACLASTAFAGQTRAVATDCSSSWRSYGGNWRSDWLNTVRVRACLPPTTCLACHKVTLVTPAGDHLVEVQDGEYILDAAERAFPNANLPSSCRTGGCSSCAGRLTSGQVDQSSQTFLDENQIRLGYVLTCVAYPLSDVVIKTHQEEQLY